MTVGRSFSAVTVLVLVLVIPAGARGGWTFSDARHSPQVPDHEHNLTFQASVRYLDDSAVVNGSTGNGTGTNGTGTNGTGTNGTGTNGTGTNGTDLNRTSTVESCHLVLEPPDNRSRAPPVRYRMHRQGAGDDYWLSLGPWPPGTELPYHFEANLSNGTLLRSNTSWARTADLLAVAWHHSFEEAAGLSRSLGRPMMVLVYSGFAQTNRFLDENLSRPSIVGLSAGFVCLRIDNETSPGFGREHGLGRLPVLLFFNATGNETARLENPFDSARVEKVMRHLLGKGPKIAAGPVEGPDYRFEAAALGAALTFGPLAMYAMLRRQKRRA